MTSAPDAEGIARRHGLALIVQFGSTVSGRVHEKSDVDVAVLFDRPPPSFDEQSRIAAELQSLFPDRELDLAVIDRADPLFLKQVFDRGRRLTGSPRRFAEMKIYAFKRYQDHRRYLELEREHVRRGIRERSS
jgi:predicted nucleotidyltransferase